MLLPCRDSNHGPLGPVERSIKISAKDRTTIADAQLIHYYCLFSSNIDSISLTKLVYFFGHLKRHSDLFNAQCNYIWPTKLQNFPNFSSEKPNYLDVLNDSSLQQLVITSRAHNLSAHETNLSVLA